MTGSDRDRKGDFSFLTLVASAAVGRRFVYRSVGGLFGKGDCAVVW